MLGSYTRGEVIWLLSLTREQAISADGGLQDSCADLHGMMDAYALSAESDLLTILRWTDVHRAKREVIDSKGTLAIMQLRAGGFSETEIARLGGRDRLAVRRRWRASVDEIIRQLGGLPDEECVTSHVDMCLRCGREPRVYLAAERRRRRRGGWKIVKAPRYASVCEVCLDPVLAPRIMRTRVVAA